jgi:Kef-type K+ transport system membrane component KefB
MLNQKDQPIENESAPPNDMQKSGPIGLVVASMVGFLVWLVFILLFALYWSEGFSAFQNIVVFIVSLCMTGLLIGLMWIIWGRNRFRMWSKW